MITAQQQYQRFRQAVRLAEVAKLEGPVWDQASTPERPATLELEPMLQPTMPGSPFSPAPIMVPTVNGRPILFQRQGCPHFFVVTFGCN